MRAGNRGARKTNQQANAGTLARDGGILGQRSESGGREKRVESLGGATDEVPCTHTWRDTEGEGQGSAKSKAQIPGSFTEIERKSRFEKKYLEHSFGFAEFVALLRCQVDR